MIKKISEKYKISETLITGILIVLILTLMLVFIFATRSGAKKFKNDRVLTSENLELLLNRINDNYTLNMDEIINGELNNVIYSRDSKMETYELYNKAYLYYNNNLFEINEENYKIKKISKEPFVDNPFYNINLLKKVFSHCEFERINNVKSICKVKFSDYILEYNNLYNQNINPVDNIIKFELIYFDDLSKINVDYTDINRIINNNSKSIKYGIRIEDIDKNNYDIFYEKYKKTLNK